MKTIKIGCNCEDALEVDVMPYYGTRPQGHMPTLLFCDKCGEERHPVTKDGAICPTVIYTVEPKLNRDNEVYSGVEIYTTSEGREPAGFPSVINTEDADSIISMIESGEEGRDYFLTFEKAEAAAKAAQEKQ